MELTHLLPNRFIRGAQSVLAPGILAVALASDGVLHVGTFTVEATTAGTWTADDSSAPRLTLHVEHPSVSAPAFSFYGLVADEVVNTAGIPLP